MRLTPRMLKQLPYPYTFGAQIKAFPAKFHFDNLWVVRAWALGMVLTAPIFLKIQLATGYGYFGEGEANQEKKKRQREAVYGH